MGGIGKSALAAAAARRLAWRYPGGVFWVDGREYLETGMRLENLLGIFGQVYGAEFGQLLLSTTEKCTKNTDRKVYHFLNPKRPNSHRRGPSHRNKGCGKPVSHHLLAP